MMLYAYGMMLYVLFRVVMSWRLVFLEFPAKFAKFHERLFYFRLVEVFRVARKQVQDLFRVVISWLGLPEAFRVAMHQVQNIFSRKRQVPRTPVLFA